MRRTSLIMLLLFAGASYADGQFVPASLSSKHLLTHEGGTIAAGDDSSSEATSADPFEPVVKVERPQTKPGVQWKDLTKDSLRFLTVMHVFRAATEPGTREAFGTPWFQSWFNAAGNLHGYADGDPFGVNYIGHPMQGAVSSFIWGNHDRAYKDVYFSRNSQYWKGRLRAAAFAYVQSVQFEIGPVSEASIGNIQSYYPQQGFVDHIVTPVVGMGWAIGEDALDRYLVRSFEDRTDSSFWRSMARSLLNPARSFANLMGGKYPWYRANRPPPSASESATYFTAVPVHKPDPPLGVAPFEFHADGLIRTYLGANAVGGCVGGGAGVGFRIARRWQIVTEISGCSLTELPVKATYGSFTDVSGDSLSYVVGPRWSSQRSKRWTMHAQFLVGGNKITQEHVDPGKKRLADLAVQDKGTWPPPYTEFARSWDNNAFAVATGAGVDMRLNNALKLRVALDYSRTWNRDINDISYRNSLQFKSGLVLDMGTW